MKREGVSLVLIGHRLDPQEKNLVDRAGYDVATWFRNGSRGFPPFGSHDLRRGICSTSGIME